MALDPNQQSDNVIDRIKSPAGLGIIGTVIVAGLAFLLGENPITAVNQAQSSEEISQEASIELSPNHDSLLNFVKIALGSTETIWDEKYPEATNEAYPQPKLIIDHEVIETSGCGTHNYDGGPFYCPADNNIYFDLRFFDIFTEYLNSPGDFAAAYVVAHEVGHHIQNLMGIKAKVREKYPDMPANEVETRFELQADFLAGYWLHHANARDQVLEEGDLEEATRAAYNIGDDILDPTAKPEDYTHGTGAQRKAWFLKGYETGDISQMDTFDGEI